MFENLVEVLKANPRKIVYTEGTDARILESAARLKQGGFLTPILVGNVEDVKAAAKAGNFDIEGLEIIDPANYDKMDEMAQCMFDLRKGKMTMEEVRANLQKGNYFGTMLVKMGVADALLGKPLGDGGDGLLDGQAVQEARIDHNAGIAVGEGFFLHIAALDHFDNLAVELLCKLPVTVIVCRHCHDRTGTISHQYIIRNPYWDLCIVDRINCLETT